MVREEGGGFRMGKKNFFKNKIKIMMMMTIRIKKKKMKLISKVTTLNPKTLYVTLIDLS